jgi:glutaredoxin
MQRPGDRSVQAPYTPAPRRARTAVRGVGFVPALGMWLFLMVLAGGAAAQFKVVAPDGTVTYSDRPPATGKAQKLQPGAVSTTAGADLPFALRQVVARYPVTLITASACAPCDFGRRLLQDRGVPFIERTASSSDDAEELRRVEQTAELPILRLGAQRMLGFNAGEWSGMLDAAGYPRSSVLPVGYKGPPAQPLAPDRAVEPVQVQPRVLPSPPSSLASPPTSAAPGGIRF